MISEPITEQSVDTYLAGIFREDAGRVLSALIAQLRDFDLAEDALQDAVSAALTAWRGDGLPVNGAAWLLTAARRKAIDRLRRKAVRDAPRNVQAIVNELEQSMAEPEAEQEIPDERLRLIFTCCNPALNQAAQIALTLRTLCGLSTREIARAFLVPEPTMAQRLVRAKGKISKAGIPYKVPEAPHLAERLHAVLAPVYLIFNEGYAATDGDTPVRADLCEEAIRLGRLLVRLTPEAEAGGLLALMLLHDSRRTARHNADGEMIALDAQDRRLWNESRIVEGTHLLRASLGRNRPGPYQVQAAISALHAEAATFAETDWPQIAGLYAALEQMTPSPVVTLNRAVAVSHCGSVEEALQILDSVTEVLAGYQPLLAARADFLRRLGRDGAAQTAYRAALELTTNAAERGLLEKQLDTLRSGD
jgi:RNA polymerase sigma-70 factor (ECF subfamily)